MGSSLLLTPFHVGRGLFLCKTTSSELFLTTHHSSCLLVERLLPLVSSKEELLWEELFGQQPVKMCPHCFLNLYFTKTEN